MVKRIISILIVCVVVLLSFSFAETKLNLTAKSAILIEASTGKVLYAENEREELRPASVTKVMTLLLIMEALDEGKIKMEDMVPCSERARKMGGSQIWMDEREMLSVNDMLKAISVVSANDCSVAIAEFIAGSEEMFVELMNKRARELKMNNTTFKNCHGIDEDGHVTSAYDIAIMSRELIKHEKIFEYTTIWMDTLREGKSQLVNTNRMIRFYSGANGLKTGSTSLAKYNLSVTAKRNNMQLVGVILSAPTTKDRFSDATKLMDYGFANYEATVLDEKGTSIGQVKIERGEEEFVEGITEKSATIVGQKGENKSIDRVVRTDILRAPILENQKIGELIYTKNGEEITKVDIVAKTAVKEISFGKRMYNIFTLWAKVGR